jgi:hypothetical protein
MPDFVEQLRFQLLQLGCPLSHMQRSVQEAADHREDLLEEALAEGLTPPAAEKQMWTRLGDPKALAEDLMVARRRSTWCGRHRFIVFALLPLLAFPLFWALVLGFNLVLGFALGFAWDQNKIQAAADNPATFHYLVLLFHGADYAAIALVAFVFCLLAGRSAAGRNWMMLACSICTLYSLFIYAQIFPHNFTVGLTDKPQWVQAAIPLLILCLDQMNRRRRVRNALKSAVA